MSWPLSSFAIVLGVLIAGWLAYERSRPSARMTAVVGTLAAVAALGRDAFVALPDVKPITAMTLVVGYALGPIPGFAVGAIGMLASNIVLGQGPYTPWQMAAWGVVGLAGAALGRISKRRLGRFGIALACAVMALVAKEIMNVYTWTLGASHTPAAFFLTAGQALPYDITDTVASFLFGFAFGPELARLLGRVRARMTVEWKPAPPPAAAALVVVALVGGGLYAIGVPARAAASSSVISRGVAYLEGTQNSDGGFGAAGGQRSSELYSAWAAMGLAAAGRDPLALRRAGHSVLDALRGEASTLEGAGDYERTILALHACGLPASSFWRRESLLGRLLRERSSDGSFEHLVNITAFAIFALRVAGNSADNQVFNVAGQWLAAQQNRDGGFGFAGRGGGEDVDDTAAALQGVVAATGQRNSGLAARAVAYLRRAQNPDGGFPQQPGGESNAQSTAWVVQGLAVAGINVASVKRGGSRSPLGYLEKLGRSRRERALLAHQRADACVGDGGGAYRAGGQAVSDRAGLSGG